MDSEKLLRALLAKVYKKQDTEIDAILGATDEATAEQQLLELDRVRVSELSKPKPGSTFQDGYAKAKKEVLTDVETRLKTAFDINEDGEPLTGDNLISAIVEKKAEGVNSTDLQKLSAEDIKKLPAFQPIARAHKQELTQVKTDLEKKISDIETGYKQKEVFGGVSKKALDILNSLNPVLDKNPTVAQNRQSSFLNSLKDGIDWQEQDGVFVPMRDGNVVVDSHGHAITLEDYAKQKAADWFEFANNNGGANGGNGKPGEGGSDKGGGNGYPKNVTKPKTWEELNATLQSKDLSPDDRLIVLDVWDKEQAAGTP